MELNQTSPAAEMASNRLMMLAEILTGTVNCPKETDAVTSPQQSRYQSPSIVSYDSDVGERNLNAKFRSENKESDIMNCSQTSLSSISSSGNSVCKFEAQGLHDNEGSFQESHSQGKSNDEKCLLPLQSAKPVNPAKEENAFMKLDETSLKKSRKKLGSPVFRIAAKAGMSPISTFSSQQCFDNKIESFSESGGLPHEETVLSKNKSSLPEHVEASSSTSQNMSLPNSQLSEEAVAMNKISMDSVKSTSNDLKSCDASVDSDKANGGHRILFPTKLHELLSCSDTDSNIIAWDPEGKSFHVHDCRRLANDILPKVFNQTSYASFQRQLNFYGFKRFTKKEKRSQVYFHKDFIREQPSLCLQIRRVKQKATEDGQSSKSALRSTELQNLAMTVEQEEKTDEKKIDKSKDDSAPDEANLTPTSSSKRNFSTIASYEKQHTSKKIARPAVDEELQAQEAKSSINAPTSEAILEQKSGQSFQEAATINRGIDPIKTAALNRHLPFSQLQQIFEAQGQTQMHSMKHLFANQDDSLPALLAARGVSLPPFVDQSVTNPTFRHPDFHRLQSIFQSMIPNVNTNAVNDLFLNHSTAYSDLARLGLMGANERVSIPDRQLMALLMSRLRR